MPTQKWQELYKHALLETEWSKVDERIWAAESAMTTRLYEFSQIGGTLKENDAIANAMHALHILRKDAALWCQSHAALSKKSPVPVPIPSVKRSATNDLRFSVVVAASD